MPQLRIEGAPSLESCMKKALSPSRTRKGVVLLVVPPCFDRSSFRIVDPYGRVNGRSRVSRLPGYVRYVLSGEDLQPIDLPSLAEVYLLLLLIVTCAVVLDYSLSRIIMLVKWRMLANSHVFLGAVTRGGNEINLSATRLPL